MPQADLQEARMTPTEAAALVEADKQERLRAFSKAVEQAAQEYRCDLMAVPTIAADGRIVTVIQVVAR